MATEKADTIIMLSTSFAWIEPCLYVCQVDKVGTKKVSS